MKKTERVDSIDDVEFNLIQQGKIKDTSSSDYVNNAELYKEYQKYHERKMECLERGLDIPPLTNKIGHAIIQIATRRCNSRMFSGYSVNWKEEMISNAIMTATIRGHSFNPERSDNPFAYLTQICNNAIIEQLKREKSQLYIIYKSMDEIGGFLGDTEDDNVEGFSFDGGLGSSDSNQAELDRREFIENFETSISERKRKKREMREKEEQIDEGVFKFID